MKIKIQKEIKELLKPLAGTEFYIVGGYVRDRIMKSRTSKDIDIITFNSIEKTAKILESKPYIINERHKTARFIIKNRFIDVNIAKNLNDDLLRRDFTINSIASDINGNITDLCGGLRDIENKILKLSSQNSIKDDPLRILRAYRFKHQFGFRFSRALKEELRLNGNRLENIPKERINNELSVIFGEINRGNVMRELYDNNILTHIFRDLVKCENFYHKKYKSKYLISHLLNTVEAVDSILKMKIPKDMKIYAVNYIYELYLSSLFHDIKKPDVFSVSNGKQQFFNHDVMGGEYLKHMLSKDLKMNIPQIKRISLLVRMHMRPHFLVNSRDVSSRGLYRLFKESGTDFEGLIIIALSDILSSEGRFDKKYLTLYRKIKSIDKKLNSKKLKFISGAEILDYFKTVKSGPIVGEMIEAGNAFALEKAVSDKKIILEYLKMEFNVS